MSLLKKYTGVFWIVNIYVYKDKFDLKAPFFTEEYQEIDKEVYKKYSLRSWLKEIFS